MAGIVVVALLGFAFGAFLGPGDRPGEGERADGPAPATARVRGADRSAWPAFPHVLQRPGFDLHADVDQPLLSLARLAERALVELRTWLAPDAAPAALPHYRIYLCRELETIRALESWSGLPRSEPSHARTFAFRGGFYRQVRMIALQCAPDEDVRWDLLHELTHAVFWEVARTRCDPIDEGLAEFAPGWLLESVVDARRLLDGHEAQLRGVCEEAHEKGDVPPLADLFALDYWQFRDQRHDQRNYALSWHLVGWLVGSREPAVAGRFPALLRGMAGAADPWEVFRQTYDVDVVEPLWRSHLGGSSRWRAVFGRWRFAPDVLTAMVDGQSSCLLTHRTAPEPGVPFAIGYRLARPVDGDPGIGFALGLRDAESYTVVALRPGEGDVVVVTRQDGAWSRAIQYPVAITERQTTSQRLELACDARGTVTLSLGGRPLMRHHLGEAAHQGRLGLFVEQRADRDDRQVTRVVFEDVQVP